MALLVYSVSVSDKILFLPLQRRGFRNHCRYWLHCVRLIKCPL